MAQLTGLPVDPQAGVGPPEAHPSADRPALRRCVAGDPDQFAADTWGRRPFLSRREVLGRGFEDLFGLDDVDDLVSVRGLRAPFVRVARQGKTLPTSQFTRGGGVGATIADQVDDAALARLFAQGSTIVLQGLHRIHPPLLAFAQQLTADLGHPTQINAYVTPPQAQGFGDHYDVHDVFVLQVAGEKRWLIRPPVHPHPLRDQPWTDRAADVERAALGEPLLDVVLRPGDALYLPGGYLHAAKALGQTSAHLTVGVHTWTRAHLLDQVLTLLGEVEALREPLPLGVDVRDPASLVLELQHTIDLVLREVGNVSARDVALAMSAQADAATRAEPVRPLAQALAGAAVDLGTVLRWRAFAPATLEDEPDAGEPDGEPALVVRTAQTSVRLPSSTRPALERMLAGESVPVSDLGRADGVSVLDDAQRLQAGRSLLHSALVLAD